GIRDYKVTGVQTCALPIFQDYLQRRDRTFQRRLSYFLVSQRGNRLDSGQVRRTFYALSRKIGLRGPTASHGPRLHDFRHRLAVRSEERRVGKETNTRRVRE